VAYRAHYLTFNTESKYILNSQYVLPGRTSVGSLMYQCFSNVLLKSLISAW